MHYRERLFATMDSRSKIGACLRDSSGKKSLDWIGSQRFFWNESPEKLKAFEVIWLKSGRGVLQADEENHILSENTIYCLTPGSVRKVNLEMESEGYLSLIHI